MMHNIQCLKGQSCGTIEICPQPLCRAAAHTGVAGCLVGVGLASRRRFLGGQQAPVLLSVVMHSLFPSAARSPSVSPSPGRPLMAAPKLSALIIPWSHLKVMLTPTTLPGVPLSCTSEFCLTATVGLLPTHRGYGCLTGLTQQGYSSIPCSWVR